MTANGHMNSSLFSNLQIISERFPALGEKLCRIRPGSIQSASTDDGGYCYVKQLENGKYLPLSDPAPINKAKEAISSMEERLSNALAPVVVVGLNPGYILENIYRHVKQRCYDNYLPRRIYVIIDSIECLYGWIKGEDRQEILNNENIEFYWHEDTKQIAELCQKDFTRSHLFTPVSSLPEQKVMKLIDPLAKLFVARQEEEENLHQENCLYYEQQSDEELETILAGEANRKPRMLIPSHASSTVVQYSVRDTKAMFEKEGWEVKVIHMKTDLSRWRVVKEINDFKPDVYMLVNHLRTQEPDFYPPEMMFITWVQDTISYINNTDNAQTWNEHVQSKSKCRDRIIGYVGQIREYGYLEDRLEECPMIVNEDLFKPRELTEEEKEKYGCDICFASNRSTPTDIIAKKLANKLSPYGFNEDILMQIHEHLWQWYRAEETFTNYKELEEKICELPQVAEIFNSLEEKNEHDFVIQRLFWDLNDVIYRHVVLEWIDEIGDIKLHLYGRGWEDHPKFAKYAKGVLEHGEELTTAYRAAKKCLHLNSMEGDHQRLNEILNGQAQLITRLSKTIPEISQGLVNFVEGKTIEPDFYTLSLIYSQIHKNFSKSSLHIWDSLKQTISSSKKKHVLKNAFFQNNKDFLKKLNEQINWDLSTLKNQFNLKSILKKQYHITKIDNIIKIIKDLICSNRNSTDFQNRFRDTLSLIHFQYLSPKLREENIQLLMDINPRNLDKQSRSTYANLSLHYIPHEKLIAFIKKFPESITSQENFDIRVGCIMRTNFMPNWQEYWLKDLLIGNFTLLQVFIILPFLNFAKKEDVLQITQHLITKLNNEKENILNYLKVFLFIKRWNLHFKYTHLNIFKLTLELASNSSNLREYLTSEELIDWANYLNLFGENEQSLKTLELTTTSTRQQFSFLSFRIYRNNFLLKNAYNILYQNTQNCIEVLQLALTELLYKGTAETILPKNRLKNDMLTAFKAVIYSERNEHKLALDTLPNCSQSPLLKLWETIVLSRAKIQPVPIKYHDTNYINKLYLENYGFSYDSIFFLKSYLQKRLTSPHKPAYQLFNKS